MLGESDRLDKICRCSCSIFLRPGDNPNQCAQGYNCPPPTLRTFDPYTPAKSRFIDVSAGGPNSFSWTAVPSASWIKLSVSSGSVTRSKPDTRIEVSVDWSKVSGYTSGQITLSTPGNSPLYKESQVILVNANKTAVSSGFHGMIGLSLSDFP